jgi:hypothetical protein
LTFGDHDDFISLVADFAMNGLPISRTKRDCPNFTFETNGGVEAQDRNWRRHWKQPMSAVRVSVMDDKPGNRRQRTSELPPTEVVCASGFTFNARLASG